MKTSFADGLLEALQIGFTLRPFVNVSEEVAKNDMFPYAILNLCLIGVGICFFRMARRLGAFGATGIKSPWDVVFVFFLMITVGASLTPLIPWFYLIGTIMSGCFAHLLARLMILNWRYAAGFGCGMLIYAAASMSMDKEVLEYISLGVIAFGVWQAIQSAFGSQLYDPTLKDVAVTVAALGTLVTALLDPKSLEKCVRILTENRHVKLVNLPGFIASSLSFLVYAGWVTGVASGVRLRLTWKRSGV